MPPPYHVRVLSTELIRRMRRFEVANHSCLMIKYAKDQRYSRDSVSTHDKTMTQAASCSQLSQIRETVGQFGVIGIDEGQFVSSLAFCV